MSQTIERKRAAKRQAILDAAARHFAESGYHPARMVDIAEGVGLQKAALYYYFDSKEAILVELIRSRVGVALESLLEITASGAAPQDKIRQAVRAHLRVFHEHADLYTIFNSERLHLISGEAASVVDELGRRYEKAWAEMVAEAGPRPDLDIPVTVKAIMGMRNTTLTWFAPHGRLTIDDLAGQYADLTLHTISWTASCPPELCPPGRSEGGRGPRAAG